MWPYITIFVVLGPQQCLIYNWAVLSITGPSFIYIIISLHAPPPGYPKTRCRSNREQRRRAPPPHERERTPESPPPRTPPRTSQWVRQSERWARRPWARPWGRARARASGQAGSARGRGDPGGGARARDPGGAGLVPVPAILLQDGGELHPISDRKARGCAS